MARVKTISIVAFAVTAIPVIAFLYAANYVFPHVLYWPGILVALPVFPLIMPAALISESFHAFAFCVFPGIFWGLVAAGISYLITGKNDLPKS